jgi:hypothetical protein
MDYKMLKAYVLNDTAGLKALWEILDLKKSRWDIMWDSCFNVKSIDEIKGEEIYRFSYTASFCRYHTVTTVIKTHDSVSVNTLVWHYEYGNTSMSCELVEQDTVLLDNTQWEKFEASLKVADFWGLKEDNGDTGLDGNTLYVDGCKRGFPKMRTRIHRWSPDEQPIQASFLLLLKYCKTKKGCLTAL